jgi:ADP-ribosylglycohydrolase
VSRRDQGPGRRARVSNSPGEGAAKDARCRPHHQRSGAALHPDWRATCQRGEQHRRRDAGAAVWLGNPSGRHSAAPCADRSASRATHGHPAAIISACVVAEMAAWAIEQHPIEAVVAAGLREADQLTRRHALDPGIMRPLRLAADGDLGSSMEEAMTLDAVATMATVLHVLRQATGLASAMKHAVALGGDTDTAAAIVGGILGSQGKDVEGEIPWLSSVVLPEPEIVEATAAGLCGLRRSFHR